MEKLELTDEEKQYIKANFDKIPLIELTRTVAKNPEEDGRSFTGKLVKNYIMELGGKPITTKYVKMDIELTEEHKEYIRRNYKNAKPLEIAKTLFPEKKNALTALNKETVLIQEFIKSFDPDAIDTKEELSVGTYRAPQKVETLLFKVVKYITKFTTGEARTPDPDNLTEQERKQLLALLGYINTHRFLSQINGYKKEDDRETFESCFIRYTYDKPDLMQEDVDQYIVICDEIVAQGKIQRTIELLDMQIDEALQSEHGAKSISGNTTELINALREKLNVSRKRVDDTMTKLISSRSKRLDNRFQENASILNLVEAWQEEKSRLQLIEVAKQQKEREAEEIETLADMDSVIALIAGFSKERARH
jgi:hypothetical protein